MATKKKVKQPEVEQQHSAADHPELDDPGYMKELVHALLHRVEFLENLLVAKKADEEVTLS